MSEHTGLECPQFDESITRNLPMDELSIRQAIEHALEQQDFGSAETRRDIAFHMTDWLLDLEEWSAFCQSPEDLDSGAMADLLTRFLVHVPNHLAAASKLMTGIPVSDIFEVDAVDSGVD